MESDKGSGDFNETRAELFEAISHPARIKILQTLNEKPMGFAELGRAVGIEGGGHLGFHLRKLTHLVKTTPEGTYALTGDGKEALWSINALRKSSNGTTSKSREASVMHRNWAKPLLGGLLIALIVLGASVAFQQQQMLSMGGSLTADKDLIANQQSQIATLGSSLTADKDLIANQQSQIATLQNQITTLHSLIATLAGNVPPFIDGMNASLVLGKPDFTTSFNPDTSNGLSGPEGAAFDSSGNLWVADGNRILEFKAPFTSGMDASIVIGQRDFTGVGSATTRNGVSYPAGLTFDASGNLWVADLGNQRVLEFKAPFSNGMGASVVIGEPNFKSSGCNPNDFPTCLITTKNGLAYPSGVAFDSAGNLWVADSDNSRVLEFTPPFANGTDASLVIGQSNFTAGGWEDFRPTYGCFSSDSGCTVAKNRLVQPCGIIFDSAGHLWVADCGSSRVLEFRPPFSNGMDASLVIGQPDFTSSCSTYSSTSCGATQSRLSLTYHAGMRFDPSGNLWVADIYDNRVLEFEAPFTNGMNASLVMGQSDFTSKVDARTGRTGSVSATTQRGLSYPADVTIDPSGNLWIVDSGNSRILEFREPFSNGMNSSLVIGKSRFTTSLPATTQSQLTSPGGVALDSSGNLWVADQASNRVLEFKPPFSNGMYASLVIGQPDFASSESARIQNRLSSPSVLGFDPSGNLWVAGSDGISEFRPPFSNGMDASLAMGQSVLTSSALFGSPGGMAFDSSGNLWIKQNGAWTNNNRSSRVLEFRAPFTNGMNASLVIGKSSFAPRGCCGGDGNGPYGGIAFDSSGNLWVADTECCSSHTSRLLEFQAPFTTDMTAYMAIEPRDFAGDSLPNSLYLGHTSVLTGIGFDSSGNLWAADVEHNRVLEYKAPFASGMNASVVIGQANFDTSKNWESATKQTRLSTPMGIGFDSSGNLWVADSGNGRVLRFDSINAREASTAATNATSSGLTPSMAVMAKVTQLQDLIPFPVVAALVMASTTLVAFGFFKGKRNAGFSALTS